MRRRLRALPLIALSAALLLIVACGGDDSKAEKKGSDSSSSSAATAAASSQSSGGSSGSAGGSVAGSGSGSSSGSGSTSTVAKPLPLNCDTEIKSLKFDGKISVQAPQPSGSASGADLSALFSGLFQNMTFSGSAVSPDRAQMKLQVGGKDSPLAGQAIEFVQIGDTSYFKLGNTGWQEQKNSNSSPTDEFNPKEICTSVKDNLSADVPTAKEKVNGVDATRYDYDRKALDKIGSGFLGGLTSGTTLPDNTTMKVWISNKDKFPVKIALVGSGTQNGQQVALNFEMNVTDLNSSSIKIEAPK